MIVLMAGCGPSVQMEQAADLPPEGWHSQNETELQRSEDFDYCNALCLAS